MASSTLSLDSLSSPSPSPSPPPTNDRKLNPPNSSTTPTATAPPLRTLDTDSELSELTDDDQDAAASASKRAVSTGVASSSKTAAGSSPDDDDDQVPASSGPVSKTGRRGTHQRSLSARGGRKKRSSIVPAPMWGWAESKASANTAPVEEEEEEMTGPPRAMEEEEEEEEEDDYDGYNQGDEFGLEEDSGRGVVSQRRVGPYATQRQPGIRSIYRKARGGGRGLSRRQPRRPDGDDNPPPEDDDRRSASGSEYASSKKKKIAKGRPTRKRKGSGGDESSGSEHLVTTKKKKNTVKAQDEEVVSITADAADSADESTESDNDALPKPLQGSKPLSSIASSSALNALAAIADAVDPTEPPSREVAAINTAAVSASIMAGSNDLEGATSPDPSPPPSRSRSHSPTTKTQTRRGAPKKLNGKPTSVVTTKKGPPPALDLKTTTALDDIPDKPIIETGDDAMEVDGEANDRPVDERDVDMEEEDEEDDGEDEASQRDEEEPANNEEALDGEEEALEVEGEDEAGEGEDEEEADQDIAEAENELENEEAENDEEPSPDGDLEEIELQPAHRAEALDVLATIELKFATLRERVYVEKMEGLAWEETMVQAAAHPEMIHLQKELSKRRDKRLELASRKRSYEAANATLRRNADEAGVWSWWKLSVDEVQTDLISETNRKRRKLERERRAIERPQPLRRIPPPPPPIDSLPPPSLRKILKSHPFGSRKQNKSDSHHHQHPQSSHPKNCVYPEISTLSAIDVANDLDFLLQHRRALTGYELQLGPPPSWGRAMSFPQQNGQGLGSLPSGMPAVNRIMTNGNGSLPPPPQNQPMIGHPPMLQHPNQLSMGYEQYGDMPSQYGPGGPPPGRVRDQPPTSSYIQGAGPQPLGATGGPRENLNVYPSFSGPPGRSHLSSHVGAGGQVYAMDEMSSIGPGGSSNGTGHQMMPHHPYFSQESLGPGAGNPYPPSTPSHPHPNGVKGTRMNGRRSPSPHVLPNGTSSSNAKVNGNWMGIGMGMGTFHLGSKGGDRDVRMAQEDEERERMMERDREQRKRADRETKIDRREQDRDLRQRDKDYQDMERERAREHQHLQHRQSGPSHIHPGGAGGPPPTQGPGVDHHHHHRPHHHHVLHRHGPQHASSSLPPPGPSGPGGVPPIVHSPRSTRDYESSRLPPSMHSGSGPGQGHSTEVITLSSGSKQLQSRDREPPSHWPSKNDDLHHHPSSLAEYRDREIRERDRDMRKGYSQRPSSRPPMIPLDSVEDRGDRPMTTPFVMASSHTMQQVAGGPSSNSQMNGSAIGSSASSPRDSRGAPLWNTPVGEDPSYRLPSAPPAGYLASSHDAHVRSPVQGHRYTQGGPPPLGRVQTSGSSSSLHRISSPPLPPGRARPPHSPSYHVPLSTSHRSPATSPKMRALSPVQSSSKALLSGPPPGSGYSSSPRLAGPGRTSTPTTGHHPPQASYGLPSDPVIEIADYPASSRTASPLMSSLHRPLSGSSRVTNGNGSLVGSGSNAPDRERSDRERHIVALSPRIGGSSMPLPPPSKLSAAQVVDGH